MKEVSEMTTKELEEALKKRKITENKKREKEKQEYESNRDSKIVNIMTNAIHIATQMQAFKELCHETMNEQHIQLDSYGKIRGNSQGGFSITHSNDKLRVIRRRETEPVWDERATKAVDLIREFLQDKVKKRDKDLFEILISFLEKNKKGDMEYAKVFQLLAHKSKFNDPRWEEGLILLQEGFRTHLKAFGYEFKTKDENGKWESLILNFSGIKVESKKSVDD